MHPQAVLTPDQIRGENWNLRRLAGALRDPRAALEWAVVHRLVRNTWTCPSCRRLARVTEYRHAPEGVRFHCRPCARTRSVRAGTWFEGTHLSIEQALIVTYCWAYNYHQYDARREADIVSDHTTVDWYAKCRGVCELWLQAHPMEVGGLDRNGQRLTVEIDESKFFRRKANRGRVGPGRWVFGGIERESGKVFMVEVPNRDRPTLHAAAVQYIRPGTHIMSDGWPSYNGLDAIPGQNYVHEVVIHDQNFVNPHDPNIHTQNCENMWMRVKQFIRRRYGVHTQHFEEEIHEWIFRNFIRVQAIYRPGRDFFEEFLVAIGEFY